MYTIRIGVLLTYYIGVMSSIRLLQFRTQLSEEIITRMCHRNVVRRIYNTRRFVIYPYKTFKQAPIII